MGTTKDFAEVIRKRLADDPELAAQVALESTIADEEAAMDAETLARELSILFYGSSHLDAWDADKWYRIASYVRENFDPKPAKESVK